MGGRIPGPMCQVRNWYDLDDGTMVRQMSPWPGSLDFVSKPPAAPSNDEPISLTGELLAMIVPRVGSHADSLAWHLNQAMKEANISSRIAQAMFLAQLAHESAGFARSTEMGGTTTYTFAKYQEQQADNQVYDYFFFMYDKDSPSPRRRIVAGRLGNTVAGDGARYHGRGFIQLTGRSNYRQAGLALGLELEREPALAADYGVASRVAAWYWKTRGLNNFANIDSESNFKEVTRLINGGHNGLADRKNYFNRAKFILMIGATEGP